MNKKIKITTSTIEEAANEFIDAWNKVENKEKIETPIDKISFKNQRLLFKTLTQKRFELLEYVHEQDGISIRALAKELDRDYSNVHQDVKILHQLGLMEKDEDNKCHVPWDAIVTEIKLPISKKQKNRGQKSHRHAANG